MEEASERMISLSEAKTALRCMRLGALNEEEAIECLDEVVDRIRSVTAAGLVSDIIEENLTATQREYIKKYWYEQKNTMQIARECGVSQASVYRTIERASEMIKELMTPVMKYIKNVKDIDVRPLVRESMEVAAARRKSTESFCEMLRDLRVGQAIPSEKLACALKIPLTELDEIESGRRVPSVTTVMRYSVIFNVEISMNFINGRGYYKWKKA